MQDLKFKAESILSNYTKMQAELRVLQYELKHLSSSLHPQIIENMVFARSINNEWVSGSHSSDKTADIAIEHTDSQRTAQYQAFTALIHILASELHRLEYYLSLLPVEEAAVIKWFYFDGLSWAKITEKSGIAQRTLEHRKKRGLDKLVHYYSMLYSFMPSSLDIRIRTRFISYVHEEQFTLCLEKACAHLNPGAVAMLYIVSGCNELWNVGAENYFDFRNGKTIPYKEGMSSLSEDVAMLLRLAYNLGQAAENDKMIATVYRYFPGLQHIHLELAIEAIKLAFFPGVVV